MSEENQLLNLIVDGMKDIKKDLREHRNESSARHATLEQSLSGHDKRIRDNEVTIGRIKGIGAVFGFIGLSGLIAALKGLME